MIEPASVEIGEAFARFEALLQSIATGLLVDRFGIRSVYASAFLVWSLASASIALSHSWPDILVRLPEECEDRVVELPGFRDSEAMRGHPLRRRERREEAGMLGISQEIDVQLDLRRSMYAPAKTRLRFR